MSAALKVSFVSQRYTNMPARATEPTTPSTTPTGPERAANAPGEADVAVESSPRRPSRRAERGGYGGQDGDEVAGHRQHGAYRGEYASDDENRRLGRPPRLRRRTTC